MEGIITKILGGFFFVQTNGEVHKCRIRGKIQKNVYPGDIAIINLEDEIVEKQKEYIQQYVKAFEDAVFARGFNGPGSYKDYIDFNTFVDYTLLNELAKNVDGYRLSTFLHKDKNGKLRAGPVWDFNLAFGNADYYNGWESSGFQIDMTMEGDRWGNPFWWKIMWADTAFANTMRCRWESLRKESWSTEQIINTTDSLVNLLEDAAERNFQRWPVMGQYVWPNYYVASSYYSEINWMKNWIRDRLSWLDFRIPGQCGEVSQPTITDLQVSIYPNPVHSDINLMIRSGKNLILLFQIFSTNGVLVREQKFKISEGEQTYRIKAHDLPGGMYLYRLYKGPALHQKGKLVKF